MMSVSLQVTRRRCGNIWTAMLRTGCLRFLLLRFCNSLRSTRMWRPRVRRWPAFSSTRVSTTALRPPADHPSFVQLNFYRHLVSKFVNRGRVHSAAAGALERSRLIPLGQMRSINLLADANCLRGGGFMKRGLILAGILLLSGTVG